MKPDRPILVVDDSEQDLLLIKAALLQARIDHPVVTVTGVDAAIKRLTAGVPPALVFLDLQMPRKDGFQLLTWLRGRTEDWRRLPVVILTTSHDYVEIRRAYDLGANSFLVKSTGFDDLRDTLAEACAYWLKRNRGV